MFSKIEVIKTSWSNEQLDKLIDPTNHKITYDGYEYRWYHKINGNKWESHFIKGYKDYNTLYSFLYFWIPLWSKELNERKKEVYRIGIKEVKKELQITKTYVGISERDDLTTKEKIEMMNNLNEITNCDEVATILKVSSTLVRNHLRNL